ncbi:hypothetical protein XELAEV_18036080mg [Xenopus laevis]|uniref:Uncharacterized protein n=1 Tax=Xenopus laevis TaxID=8355 RepID=A0A974CI42_XENLA|nr:hypothetical protein XELAEV_18036080mg [Xenopus laevis]
MHTRLDLVPNIVTPPISLLGTTEELPLKRPERLLLLQLFFLLKKLILLHLKDFQAPTIGEWKQLVNANLTHIKAIYISRNCPSKFKKIWAKWTALDTL